MSAQTTWFDAGALDSPTSLLLLLVVVLTLLGVVAHVAFG